MTDDSQPPSYGPPPGQGPYQGQPPQYGPPPPQYGQPQYGQPQYYQPGPYEQPYQPGPYGTPQRFGPQVDPKLIRPRMRWIAIAWGLALLSGLVGVGLFAGGIFNTVSAAAPSKTFASGETVTVPLDPADKPVLYLSSQSRVHYTCRINGGPGQAKLARTSVTQTVSDGATQWQLILVVNAPAKGDYQLTCATQEQANARFGVGRDLAAAAGGLVGGVAALLVIPGLGVLAAIIVTIMVVTRRSSHRKRLAAGG